MMQTFGLPSGPPPTPDELQRRIDVRSDALGGVVSSLGSGLNGAIGARAADLKRVQGTLNRALSSRINARTATVQGVAQDLTASLAEQVAKRATLLNLLPPGAATMAAAGPVSLPAAAAGNLVTNAAGFYLWHAPGSGQWVYTVGIPPGWPAQLYSAPTVYPTEEDAIKAVLDATQTTETVRAGVGYTPQSGRVSTAGLSWDPASSSPLTAASSPPLTANPPTSPISPAAAAILAQMHANAQVAGGLTLGPTAVMACTANGGTVWFGYEDYVARQAVLDGVHGDILGWSDGLGNNVGDFSSCGGASSGGLPSSGIFPSAPVSPPPVAPLPPLQPPPTITSPPTPPQWFCVRSPNADGTYSYSVLQAANILDLVSSGQEYVSGPYVSQDLAAEACQSTTTQVTRAPSCPASYLPDIPSWCDVNICSTIDQITAALHISGNVDVFAALGAGDMENPGGDDTWLGKLGSVPAVGQALQAFITYALCKVQSGVSAVLQSDTGTAPQWIAIGGLKILVGVLEKFLGHGFHDIDTRINYWADYLQPTEIPRVHEADELYQTGFVSQEQWRCWVRANNVCDEPRKLLRDSGMWHPGPEHVERVYRMGWIDDDVYQTYMAWNKMPSGMASSLWQSVYTQIPTISDILHFLTRNVFDTEYVRDYQLMDGFEDKFWPAFGQALTAQGIPKEVAVHHYAAHWVNPAPTQMQEMVYRLRPGKAGVNHPFTIEDYQRILTEQDVAPYARPRFAEIAYRVPALTYLKDMFRQGVISAEQLASYHQDLGYTAADSDRFVAIDDLQRKRMRVAATHGWTPANTNSAFVMGRITDVEHNFRFVQLGYTVEEAADARQVALNQFNRSIFTRARSRALTSTVTYVRSAIRTGAMSAATAIASLVQAGWPRQYVEQMVTQEELGARVEAIKRVQSAIRGAFKRGEVDAAGAATVLRSMGIQEDWISQNITLWQLEITRRVKHATAAQVTKAVAAGQMSTPEGLAVLMQLGYDDPAAQLFLADARRMLARREASELSRTERVAQRSASATARAARSAQVQQQRLLASLKRLAPPGKLQRWAKLGIIGRPRFFSLMSAYGYPDSDIERYWTEACQAKNAACTEAAPLDALNP